MINNLSAKYYLKKKGYKTRLLKGIKVLLKKKGKTII